MPPVPFQTLFLPNKRYGSADAITLIEQETNNDNNDATHEHSNATSLGIMRNLEQMDFADKDVTDGIVTPFCNETDKCTEVTYCFEKQLTIQPNFAKTDKNCSRNKTLTSADISIDRSENKRAVRLSKQSGYINKGV